MTRTPTRAEALAMLDELYAQIPALECKGLCHNSCTRIEASELERQRIRERGKDIGESISGPRELKLILAGEVSRCPALGPLNTCTVYDIRPMICRVWGVAEGLLCEFGCIPDGIIPRGEVLRTIAEIEGLSRLVTGYRRHWGPGASGPIGDPDE